MDDNQNSNIEKLRRYVQAAEESLLSARKALAEIDGGDISTEVKLNTDGLKATEGGKIIEGIFDGENMVGPENKVYPVPANYASKSKLIEGDRLKLTVADDGSFIFKQIGPAERKKLVGVLSFEDNAYHVLAEGRSFNVLYASVTYYKAKPGEKVTIVVPVNGQTNWAALDNIIHDVKAEPAVEETGIMEEQPSGTSVDMLSSVPSVDSPVLPEARGAVEPAQAAVDLIPTPVPQQQEVAKSPSLTVEPQTPFSMLEEQPRPEASTLPEESFLPRVGDEEANSLGEKALAGVNEPAQSATELEI